MRKLTLSVLQETLAICRLDPAAPLPEWVCRGNFFAITRTPEELSLVCPQGSVPEGTTCDKDWRGLKVSGPLDFALTGILASLAAPLANAGIALFALSTYDTDYVLVKSQDLKDAIAVLSQEGHLLETRPLSHPNSGF